MSPLGSVRVFLEHFHRSLTHRIITTFPPKIVDIICFWVKQYTISIFRFFFSFGFKINRILWINLHASEWMTKICRGLMSSPFHVSYEFIFVDMTFGPFHLTLTFYQTWKQKMLFDFIYIYARCGQIGSRIRTNQSIYRITLFSSDRSFNFQCSSGKNFPILT